MERLFVRRREGDDKRPWGIYDATGHALATDNGFVAFEHRTQADAFCNWCEREPEKALASLKPRPKPDPMPHPPGRRASE